MNVKTLLKKSLKISPDSKGYFATPRGFVIWNRLAIAVYLLY